jgi:hypothetical protein
MYVFVCTHTKQQIGSKEAFKEAFKEAEIKKREAGDD